jgi:hypothetical protein
MPARKTKQIAFIATCAALYAVAIGITASVPTPWGVGQFRPGVVVPAIYAFIGGASVAGWGAAVGTFLGSFILQAAGTGLGPLGSLVSGSPANFVGFYLLGWFVTKFRSWKAFVLGSFVSLLIGNLVAAVGVVFYLTYVLPTWATMMLDVKIGTIVGLTLFWTVTMIPFVLVVVPLVVTALNRAGLPAVEVSYLRSGTSKDLIYSCTVVAVTLGVIYALIVGTDLGNLLFAAVVRPANIFWVKALFAMTAGVMVAIGIVGAIFVSRSSQKSSALG